MLNIAQTIMMLHFIFTNSNKQSVIPQVGLGESGVYVALLLPCEGREVASDRSSCSLNVLIFADSGFRFIYYPSPSFTYFYNLSLFKSQRK